ncbi:type IV pilus biogenesis protein, putative [Shewanella baltica OS625]|uniref:Type II secretion system protein H n=1 Tax=Shewanella baltica (strain OS195) TaxID=399599 RepID=A9L4V8_SHEB9|nr:GspH/FimT family pseudopilin [Shewanella baltica]ABX48343.1 type IV pilus biogenesis protein, putative [Shewanella baltica OS195]ADT93373.1 type IV pilus biogenesis protein, putative [Shewanella baltica OS678]EHC06594.1 type IV pilus biogenesis protein, putative [Shewanella baltica OS625]
MNTHQKGFSLIELMTTLSISTILFTVGTPSFTDLSDQIRADSNIRTIQQTLMLARNTAINYGYRVTVCPLVDGKCTQNWQKGLTVFIDSDTVETLDVNDKVIRIIDEFDTKDFLKYNKSSIKFQPDGLASGSNGTFKYCPRTVDSKNSRAIVVNQAGRIRFSTAKNISCD